MVFRAPAAAAKTAALLTAAGHVVSLAPVTRVVTRPIEWPGGRFDAVLATSANAFSTKPPDEALLHRPVFAVGRATAEAARAAGFRDTRVATGDAAFLVTLVRLTLPRPGRLLYLAGHDRKPMTEALLTDAGYRIETIEAYAAEPVARWSEDMLAALRTGTVDAALHFSRRSAELALELASRHDIAARFLDLPHVCLSDDVAMPLRDAGARAVSVATRPDEAALLELLASRPA